MHVVALVIPEAVEHVRDAFATPLTPRARFIPSQESMLPYMEIETTEPAEPSSETEEQFDV